MTDHAACEPLFPSILELDSTSASGRDGNSRALSRGWRLGQVGWTREGHEENHRCGSGQT